MGWLAGVVVAVVDLGFAGPEAGGLVGGLTSRVRECTASSEVGFSDALGRLCRPSMVDVAFGRVSPAFVVADF